jgi:hypothetical protein
MSRPAASCVLVALLFAPAAGCAARWELVEEGNESYFQLVDEAYFAYTVVRNDKDWLGGWYAAVRLRPGTRTAQVIQVTPPITGIEPFSVEGKPADVRGRIAGRRVAEPGEPSAIVMLSIAPPDSKAEPVEVGFDVNTKVRGYFGVARPGSATADDVREAISILGQRELTRDRKEVRDWFREYAFDDREDPQVRVAALTALRANRVELSVSDLLLLRTCLDASVDRAVRAEAAECLGVYRHRAGAQRLKVLLAGAPVIGAPPESDPMVRIAAIRSLGKYSVGTDPTVAARVLLEAGSPEPAVRAAAAPHLRDLSLDERLDIAGALTADLELNEPGAFIFKHEKSLSLTEITGQSVVGGCPKCRYDKGVWRRLLTGEPATVFANGGAVDPRKTLERSGWATFGDFWYRTYRMLRKEERLDE